MLTITNLRSPAFIVFIDLSRVFEWADDDDDTEYFVLIVICDDHLQGVKKRQIKRNFWIK